MPAPASLLIAAPADPGLASAYEASRELTRKHAKSFYFASFVLPAERRAAAYAIYAFCRAADDAVDESVHLGVAEQRRRLAEMGRRLDDLFAGRPSTPVDAALADVARRYRLEKKPFDELLEGMAIDLEPVKFRTWAELADYCHKVAGVVGHMLLPVLGAEGEEARARAADLGVAMQLTNILRDVGEDLDRGRIYLPEEELALFGLTHADVEARRVDARWVAFMQAQVARARDYYARADAGVPLIRTWGGRLCTRVMRVVYGDILRLVARRGYDSFSGRASTGTGRKLLMLFFALFGRLPPSARHDSARPASQGPLGLLPAKQGDGSPRVLPPLERGVIAP